MDNPPAVKYLVAEFKDGIFIVAANWLADDGKTCQWPPYADRSRVRKAARLMEVPNDSWSDHWVTKIWARTSE